MLTVKTVRGAIFLSLSRLIGRLIDKSSQFAFIGDPLVAYSTTLSTIVNRLGRTSRSVARGTHHDGRGAMHGLL